MDQQRRILLIESDLDFAQYITDELSRYNLAMDMATDGADGLHQARSNPPDLILLSVELPDKNGYAICNRLKKNPDLKRIPLIIMSSEATEEAFAQHRQLRTRAEDYLFKPFEAK